MKSIHTLLPLAIITAVAATSAAAAKIVESYSHAFPLDDVKLVSLKNTNGGVDCASSAEVSEIAVSYTITVEGGSDESAREYFDKIKVDIVRDGDELKVKAELPKTNRSIWNWFGLGSPSGSISYELEVPANVGVNLESVNGRLNVDGVSGNTRAATVNGAIRASNLGAPAQMETVNGSITASFSDGAIGGDMSFSTVNGSVRAYLPEGAAFDLSVDTVNGSVGTDFELPADARKDKRHLKAQINGGGPGVRASTVNGSVRVKQGAGD